MPRRSSSRSQRAGGRGGPAGLSGWVSSCPCVFPRSVLTGAPRLAPPTTPRPAKSTGSGSAERGAGRREGRGCPASSSPTLASRNVEPGRGGPRYQTHVQGARRWTASRPEREMGLEPTTPSLGSEVLDRNPQETSGFSGAAVPAATPPAPSGPLRAETSCGNPDGADDADLTWGLELLRSF